jgi:Sulfatase-modifying factor enzyme 1
MQTAGHGADERMAGDWRWMSEKRVAVISGSNRVMRGGSWNNSARNCRSAIRNRNSPDNRNDNLGFRLARAQQGLDGPRVDPTVILSVTVFFGNGEKQMHSGMLVATMDVVVRRLAGTVSSLDCGGDQEER